VTRARKRMLVISSFAHFHMDPARLKATVNRGPELLRLFLEFAHRHGDAELLPRVMSEELNGFEQSVLHALERQGIPVYPQWGVSEYRIDFALAHPERPGQMVLAVETDGASYHHCVSARDRDRLRQDQLERLGWRFHRLWSTDWFRDPEAETRRIVERWQQACQAANEEHEPEEAPPPPPPATVTDTPAGAARGPRPRLPRHTTIRHYTDAELVRHCRWLLRDRLPVPRDDRINEAIETLGFQRRTRVMEERLRDALIQAEHILEREEVD
jgi:very-short-patch-repair endonuclease